MTNLIRAYDRLIALLAVLASAMVATVFVIIVVDVSMRTAGFRPPAFSSAVSEYSLIYMTMLAAPWLVRNRGHVRVDSFLAFMPPAGKLFVERVLIVVCMILCVFAAYLSCSFAIEFWRKGEIDLRSIELPRALLFVPLVIGFALCAVEFARLLLLREGLTAPDKGKDHATEGRY